MLNFQQQEEVFVDNPDKYHPVPQILDPSYMFNFQTPFICLIFSSKKKSLSTTLASLTASATSTALSTSTPIASSSTLANVESTKKPKKSREKKEVDHHHHRDSTPTAAKKEHKSSSGTKQI